MTRLWLLILSGTLPILALQVGAVGPGTKEFNAVRSFGPNEKLAAYNTRRFLLSPEVVFDREKDTIRLAGSVLLTDEQGATDYKQTEALSDRVQVKKVFVLDDADVTGAQLLLFGSAKYVRVNGQEVSTPSRVVSTGWSRCRIPDKILKAGENTVVLSGGGQLLLEPARKPGRSFKSTDGGRTWSNQLGTGDNQPGEYLIRLRLDRHAPRGWALSPVFDLWSPDPAAVAVPGRVRAFKRLATLQRVGSPAVPLLRTGSTPTPDDRTWTGWVSLEKEHRPTAPADRHRWAQLKFELSTSRPDTTPWLDSFALNYDLQRDAAEAPLPEIVSPRSQHFPDVAFGSVSFTYQAPSPRLKLLRERYKLDEVVAPGKTEMEQLMLLRYWVRNQWHTAWGSSNAAWMPPWDALIILESKDQPDCLTMCTHYAAVFTQCCLALGWNARHCILDHHCVSEVWVDQHRRWVMMDAGNSAQRADVGLHFERGGLPLSALELHTAQRSGQTEGIRVCFTPAALAAKVAPLCRPAPRPPQAPRPDAIPLEELPKYPVCQLDNYRRYAFPARNNYLASLVPGEHYQGWSEYFYDGYHWVGDSPDAPVRSPEYSLHLPPSRPQDVNWDLNWTRIHLSQTGKPDEVQVHLETHTPNLARFEKRTEASGKEGNGKWQPAPAAFVWRLGPGDNVLTVRSVNRWGRAGAEARVQVRAKR
jgi:hypothetical protein